MSSRPYIVHRVSTTEPTGQQLGDEWFNPTTNQLTKTLAVSGNAVIASEVLANVNGNIVSSGNLLITGAITVGQSTGAQTLNLGTGATLNATTKTINIGTNGVSGSTTNVVIGSSTAGAINNTTINGNLTVNGTITETSSITLKQNIRPLQNVMPNVMQLSPVIYDRRDGTNINEPGLIAEQVESVIPELVGRDQNGRITGIYYTKLTVYLLEAIKTLQQEINELKKRS
jgi:hypothetical protein